MVLNNRESTVRVSPETAERIRQTAQQLGYRVNVLARNFRDRHTRTIGVLNGRGMARPTFAKGPRYFATLMDGIVEGAFRRDYSVTLCPKLLGENPEMGVDGRFDGLVWYSVSPTDENREVLSRFSIPIVIVHAHASDFGYRYPAIIANNRHGLGLAVEHLFELGHRRIGFVIEGDALNVESLERLEAFKHHLSEHGLTFDKDRDLIDVHANREEMHRYLSATELPHTAVIVHADGLASEFVVAAQKHRWKLPDELSVVGFDSTDFCNETSPALTSISQPLFDIGGLAVERLLKLIDGQTCDPLELTLPCGLDIRGSTTIPHRG
jgi:DNA-binding LacI/PurR family transcriptional regulator